MLVPPSTPPKDRGLVHIMWALLGAAPSGWNLPLIWGAFIQFEAMVAQLVFCPSMGLDQ